ncbi:hypothetical protein [Streptomyces shenzhenensis]|uniref:hypothetical protein n=1 Tax=Streptomyces shenzhenensis TaxID=943815 RepID=UPI0036880B5A
MNIDARLEELISALQSHAAATSEPNPSEDALQDAFTAVRDAARSYSEAATEMSGYEGPFYDLELTDEDESDEPNLTTPENLLRVSGTWDFQVIDGESWVRFVSRQLSEAGSQTDVHLSGDPAEAVAALLECGKPWSWLGSHGLEFLGSEWSVGDNFDPLGEGND